MSRRSRFVAAIAVLTAVAGCGGGGSGSGKGTATKTFRSSVYGYAIARPAAWSAVAASHMLADGQPPATGGGGTDILGVNASTKVSQITLPALVIGGQKLAPTSTIAQWSSDVISTVSFMKSCPQPDGRESITVGGESAVLLRYDDCPRGSGLFHFWIAAVHKGVGYHIVWFDQKSSEVADRPALDEMLASFVFT